MFETARFKLTAWYLLIIMVISCAFSLVIYRETAREVERGLRAQQVRIWAQQGFFAPPFANIDADQDLLTEELGQLRLVLFLANLGILVVAGGAGYFLAGKTLTPIETMLEEQKRFVADASHELRTPLTAIKTEIEVAARNKSLDLIGAKKLIKSNLEEVNKMQSLSDYLLQLSRYQSNAFKLPAEEVDLQGVVSRAVDKLEPIAKMRGVVIKLDIAPVRVSGNKDSLVELVGILLDNAIKYSQPKKQIIVAVEPAPGGANVSVQDFGTGIKASDLPHIFDRFYRADSSRGKSLTPGYGLGLSIAKSIVDLHKGKISAQSSPAGSIFKVFLSL